MREFTFSLDLAKILLLVADSYNEAEPINIGNTDEYSIKKVVEIICDLLAYDGSIIWRTDLPNGQARKPSDNNKLLNLGWKLDQFTCLKTGLKTTCDWFVKIYPKVRGVLSC